MSIASIIIDIVLVAIVAFLAWRGYRDGLVASVCGLLALVISVVGAHHVSKAYSQELVPVVSQFVGGAVDSAVTNAVSELPGNESTLTLDEKKDVYTVSYTVIRKLGLPERVAANMATGVADAVQHVGREMNDALTDTLSIRIAYIALFLIAFVILIAICAVISSLINLVFELPGLHLLDSLSGLTFGIAKGVFVVLVITLVLRYLDVVLPKALLDNTHIARWLMEENLLATWLGV